MHSLIPEVSKARSFEIPLRPEKGPLGFCTVSVKLSRCSLFNNVQTTEVSKQNILNRQSMRKRIEVYRE